MISGVSILVLRDTFQQLTATNAHVMDTWGLLEEASQAPVTLATAAVFKSNRADILTNQRVDNLLI